MKKIDTLGSNSTFLQNRIQKKIYQKGKTYPTFDEVNPKWEQVETQSLQQGGNKSVNPYVELKRACLEMESIFTKMMFDAMKKTIYKENFLGEKSAAQDIFEDMMMVHRARNASYTQSIGIAKSMYEQNVTSVVEPKK